MSGSTDQTDVVLCKRLTLAKPIETIGWGGARARPAVDHKSCRIEVDLVLRTYKLTPLRGGAEPLEGPLEAVVSWTRLTAAAEKQPDPEPEPEPKAWTRKPPGEKLRKPRSTAPVAVSEPVSPTAT